MKANELMIGDWVVYEGDTNYDNPIRIEGMDFATKSLITSDREDVGFDGIEPIPLTKEILEKNGWKKEFDKVDYMVKYDLAKEGKNCWMMWAIKEHNLDIQRQDEKLDMYILKVQKVCMPCDFVHELQHALRLCGIEKEIVL